MSISPKYYFLKASDVRKYPPAYHVHYPIHRIKITIDSVAIHTYNASTASTTGILLTYYHLCDVPAVVDIGEGVFYHNNCYVLQNVSDIDKTHLALLGINLCEETRPNHISALDLTFKVGMGVVSDEDAFVE